MKLSSFLVRHKRGLDRQEQVQVRGLVQENMISSVNQLKIENQ